MWEHVYQSEKARGLDEEHAARAAWGAVKQRYTKKRDRWVKRRTPVIRHGRVFKVGV